MSPLEPSAWAGLCGPIDSELEDGAAGNGTIGSEGPFMSDPVSILREPQELGGRASIGMNRGLFRV